MKRLLNVAGGLLGLLALITLVVALALTFGGLGRGAEPAPQAFQSPIETPTQPPYPLPATSTPPVPLATPTPLPYPPPGTPTPPGPPATPTIAPMPVPRCTFAAPPVPAVPGPSLDAYHFSEPQVVLTHTSAIGIAGWLPDGQRLLINRLIPGQAREYIEIFNVQTGELQRYGERHRYDAKPVWLNSERAVAFVDVSPDKQKVLRISRGEGAPVEEAITGLAASYLAASPDGRRVVFFTKATQNRPEAFDVAQAQRQTFPFTLPLTPWQDLPALGQQVGPEPYRAAWNPNGNQIAFYNDTGFYLADLATGQICEIDLGLHMDGKRWALDARWSPNGRYLSILTTIGDLPVPFAELAILDTATGEMHQVNLGVPYIFEIAWAPNSRYLIALGQVNFVEGRTLLGLYAVDVLTSEFRRVLPDHVFSGGIYLYEGGGLAWSPNGQTVFTKCPIWLEREPTVVEDRLCAIEVNTRP